MNSGEQQHPAGNNCRERYERHGRFRVWRRGGGIDSALLAALLPNPDQVFAAGEILPSPWQGPGTDKVRITLAGESYFFKRYNCFGLHYGVKNLFRRSRAVKSWMSAQLFAKHCVPTPEPLLCLEERRFGLLGRAYLLFPFLDGEAASFYGLWPYLQEAQRRSCLVTLGDLIGRMHRQGLLHGDLNWRNIVVVPHHGDYRFWLVDLDGSRKVRKVSPALAGKDLAHFLRDMERAGADEELRMLFRENWQLRANLPLTNIYAGSRLKLCEVPENMINSKIAAGEPSPPEGE